MVVNEFIGVVGVSAVICLFRYVFLECAVVPHGKWKGRGDPEDKERPIVSNPLKKTWSWLAGPSAEDYAQYPAAPVEPAPPRSTASTWSVFAGRRRPEFSEIATFQLRKYADVRDIASFAREGVPVIVNIADMPKSEARRVLDFLVGVTEALQGHIKRITQTVYLMTPHDVQVNDEDDLDEHMAPPADDLIIKP